MHLVRMAAMRRKVSEREGAPDGVQSLVQLYQEGKRLFNSVQGVP